MGKTDINPGTHETVEMRVFFQTAKREHPIQDET